MRFEEPKREWPRILVVGPTFSQEYGLGTYLGHLFSGCPPGQVAVATDHAHAIDWSRCGRVYRLGRSEFTYPWLAAWANRYPESGPVSGNQTVPVKRQALWPTKVARLLLQEIVARVWSTEEVLVRPVLSARIREWINAFAPELIYAHCTSLVSGWMAQHMARELGLPLVLHAMDDWGDNLYRAGLWNRRTQRRWRTLDQDLTRSAAVAIAICEEMSRAYQQRYGRKWEWLPMPVDWSAWKRQARCDWSSGQTFHIRYGGRIGWSIRNSIVAVARAVDQLRAEGEEVEFEIRTFQPEALALELRGLRGVTLEKPGLHQELAAAQASADVLLVCYDFGEEAVKMAQYSMASKTTECMASGTPCLVYGPAGLPVVEYARREGWGLVVDDPSAQALREAILKLRREIRLRQSLGCRGKHLVETRHDAQFVSEEFRKLLTTAASMRGRRGGAA